MIKIIEYFASGDKEHWRKKIAAGEWNAAGYLAKLLELAERSDIPQISEILVNEFGKDPRVFLLTEGEELISFAALTEKDCIDAPELSPWIGFVYTFPGRRRMGYSKRLLSHICDTAAGEGAEKIWLATGHTDLYEHYGFSYAFDRPDRIIGELERVYFKELKK